MESRHIRFEEGLPHRTLPIVTDIGNDHSNIPEEDPISFDHTTEPPTIPTSPHMESVGPDLLHTLEMSQDQMDTAPIAELS